MQELEAINKFNQSRLNEHLEIEKKAMKERENFIIKYPVSNILNLSFEEYSNFCYWLKNKLKNIASMGNIYPATFGIYNCKEDNMIKLSKTYETEFGNDYSSAFIAIKNDIYKLLCAGKNKDYDYIKNSRLNKSFVYKLLTVYFPKTYFPVCSKETLITYCSMIGYNIDYNSVDMINDSEKLRKWRDSFIESSSWSDHTLMGFFVWMLNSKITITGKSTSTVSKHLIEVEQIEQQLSNFNVEGKERETLIKQRVNQSCFRNELLAKQQKCALCNIKSKKLLIASHIKPWAMSEPLEKLDADNGLLLCPNHDKLFDCGLITFDSNGLINISDELPKSEWQDLKISITTRIKLTDSMCKYMTYHNTHIFKK